MNRADYFWPLIALGAAVALTLGGTAVYRHFKQRGIRNNNPGNLRLTWITWTGKVPNRDNTDGAFEQFRDYQGTPGHVWGLRAMYKDVRGDVIRKGQDTPRKLISSYAPPHENETARYIANVAAALKIGADDRIQDAHYPALLGAIIRQENGIQPYPDADIRRAIALA